MKPKLGNKDQEFQKLYEQVVRAKTDWQNTFDSIPDMICILDKDAKIMRVNRSFSERLNKSYEELVGHYCFKVLHAAGAPPVYCPLKTVLKTGRPMHLEKDIEIGGALFSASIMPSYDSVGNLYGAIHIFRDITEQKKVNDKLVLSKKMTALGMLASEIAHEINNPLLYISNYLYLLSEELAPDSASREYLEKIQGGIDRLTLLTKDLLEFSRPHVHADAFLPVDIHEIIDSALEQEAQNISGKRIGIVKQYGGLSKPVQGSKQMLGQAFAILIQNAVDALKSDGKVTIRTSNSADSVSLEFEDTGAGIAEENVSRIFDPFFTTKNSPSKKKIGLSLAVCYNIIKQHQGDIHVTSKEGKGTKVNITLPLASQQK